ncbi:Rpn family recombination-promoting nuclease/putative transposase [Nocardia otitidiscaviarum]|uniref:Rpn family recombination-promoting nuclease/putative transposase n=1 Tax=Nocardia otitidiscaviarum TaxID=1823 RepID=A0A516NML6_9NOCA|nr:Rpn family recombination-promoting nuclease/putative transposase [Nocardia otitidiscaviarum]MCP9624627.1 Rpn family recombination-promoting nuclease/putative transposase [Nocardia otitidiscaviarum]QDP80141.1 Rpn family recombination-promoting nuclease/putative transposase [Nocardia otitidiscaviarum]
MTDSPSNPHDAYFRHVMSRPADVAGELRAMLPASVVTRLDWDALVLQPCSFVSQRLRSRYSDLLFRTRLDGHEALVYLLVEHQSRPDPLMPMRMLEYLVAIWNRYLGDHSQARMLPVVIPLVVHASPDGRRWEVPTELSEVIDIDPATRDALGACLPRFRFLLDDLTAQSVPTYILTVGNTSDSDLGPVVDRLGPEVKEVIVTAAEQLRAEGEARGAARGRAELLFEQLTLKFGPLAAEVESTVRGADSARLRVWAARVLTADSIDAVFE